MAESKFTNEQLDAITTWIEEKVGDLKCPLCGQDEWSVGDLWGRIFGDMSRLGYPIVILVCVHCAYTLAFNTMLMGIERRDDTDDDERGDNG